VLIVLKSGRFILEPSGPVKACNGIALPLPLLDQAPRHEVWEKEKVQLHALLTSELDEVAAAFLLGEGAPDTMATDLLRPRAGLDAVVVFTVGSQHVPKEGFSVLYYLMFLTLLNVYSVRHISVTVKSFTSCHTDNSVGRILLVSTCDINPLTPNDLYRRRAVSRLKIKISSKKSW
jgi:hypothetical protein